MAKTNLNAPFAQRAQPKIHLIEGLDFFLSKERKIRMKRSDVYSGILKEPKKVKEDFQKNKNLNGRVISLLNVVKFRKINKTKNDPGRVIPFKKGNE